MISEYETSEAAIKRSSFLRILPSIKVGYGQVKMYAALTLSSKGSGDYLINSQRDYCYLSRESRN